MRRFLAWASLGFSLIYVITLAGYVLFRGVPLSAPWWLDLTNTFALYLFIPALPVLMLGLLSFSRRTLLLFSFPVILFGFLYGGLFLPKFHSAIAQGTALVVMTHNVDAGNPNLERVAQVIVETDADIVALQELAPDMADLLTARLSNKYQYRALLPQGDYSGVGVFSRFPIQSEESFRIGHLGQHLVLDVDGQKLHLFNFHPLAPEIRLKRGSFPPYMVQKFDTSQQSKEMAEIMARIGQADGPVVVTGDFNMTDQSRQYGRVAQALTDTYREAGWGFGHTFPANEHLLGHTLPLLRIDYIFHSRELTGLDAHIGNSTGSDHLPVVARLSLMKAGK